MIFYNKLGKSVRAGCIYNLLKHNIKKNEIIEYNKLTKEPAQFEEKSITNLNYVSPLAVGNN